MRRYRARIVDNALIGLGFLFGIHAFIRDRRAWQPLAEVDVPNAMWAPAMCFLLVRQRKIDRASASLEKVAGDLGTLIGTRMKEGDDRAHEVLELNRSVKRLTKWLVILTVALGVIGVASIVVTLANA